MSRMTIATAILQTGTAVRNTIDILWQYRGGHAVLGDEVRGFPFYLSPSGIFVKSLASDTR